MCILLVILYTNMQVGVVMTLTSTPRRAPNIFLQPHSGSATLEARREMQVTWNPQG
jgi:hypothetical protein